MYPIIRKCLNPDPSGRYANMDEVIRDMMLLEIETKTAHVVDLPKEVHRVRREEREEPASSRYRTFLLRERRWR